MTQQINHQPAPGGLLRQHGARLATLRDDLVELCRLLRTKRDEHAQGTKAWGDLNSAWGKAAESLGSANAACTDVSALTATGGAVWPEVKPMMADPAPCGISPALSRNFQHARLSGAMAAANDHSFEDDHEEEHEEAVK